MAVLIRRMAELSYNFSQALAYVKASKMHADQAPNKLDYCASLVQNRAKFEQQRQERISAMGKA